jgi:xylulokinase
MGSNVETGLISSPFLDKYVHYGVTASSGKSLAFAARNFGADKAGDKYDKDNVNKTGSMGEPAIPEHAPIFLPYLAGERAPVFDPDARGMFAGLSESSSPDVMKYSVCEGVVFSIYDIYKHIGCPAPDFVSTTGGASSSALLNRLKASIFGVPFISEKYDCGSAIGAVIAAGAEWKRDKIIHEPEPWLTDFLRRRFEIYRRMYGAWLDIIRDADVMEIFGR